MHICADRLIHLLEVCLRENPTWSDGRVFIIEDDIFLFKNNDFIEVGHGGWGVTFDIAPRQLELPL